MQVTDVGCNEQVMATCCFILIEGCDVSAKETRHFKKAFETESSCLNQKQFSFVRHDVN